MSGLTDIRQFAAWQRADELRQLVRRFLTRPGVTQRFRSAAQLEAASASVARNIAEGFGRFRPREFAAFVRIAKGSATEVLDLLVEAQSIGILGEDEFHELETATRRAIGTAVGLIRYLERAAGPTPTPPAHTPPSSRRPLS